MRGGEGINYSLAPANIDLGPGAGMEPSTNVQFAAGMSGGRRRRMSRRGRSRRGGVTFTSGGARRRSRRARRSRRSRRSRR